MDNIVNLTLHCTFRQNRICCVSFLDTKLCTVYIHLYIDMSLDHLLTSDCNKKHDTPILMTFLTGSQSDSLVRS
jgi:hypothetical protein